MGRIPSKTGLSCMVDGSPRRLPSPSFPLSSRGDEEKYFSAHGRFGNLSPNMLNEDWEGPVPTEGKDARTERVPCAVPSRGMFCGGRMPR